MAPSSQFPITGSMFSADRAILRRADDELKRDSFAVKMAEAIRGWNGNDSLVLALFGSWGSGKTSLKNMVLEALTESLHPPVVVDFSVWQYANRDQLTEAFFDQLGVALGKGAVGSRKDRRALARRWRRYAAYIGGTHELTETSTTGLQAVLALSGFALLSAAFPRLSTVSALLGGMLLVAAAVLKWASGMFRKIGDMIAIPLEVERYTLEEVKADVASSLRQLKVPVLVVLDDLDRLTPTETAEMLQLVKANGDFPNVVYLLLCQRSTVEAHLAKALTISNGREYLDKIVQVSFDIPTLQQTHVHRLLFRGLDSLLARDTVSKHFDKLRWGNLFHGGLSRYFTNLRQVNRFISSLAFHIAVFDEGTVFEVNPIDLIALEVLRIFEPEVYHALPRNKGLLTSSIYHFGDFPAQRTKLKAEAELLLTDASEETRTHVQAILTFLFPRLSSALGGMSYSADFETAWQRDLLVAAPDIFDRYFSFAIPEGDISQGIIDRLVEHTSDREVLRSDLEALHREGSLPTVLDRLDAYKDALPLENSVPLCTALFDVGDWLSDDSGEMFGLSPEMHAVRIIHWHLKRHSTPGERLTVLRTALKETIGLQLPVSFVSLEIQGAEKAKTGASDMHVLDDPGIAEVRQLALGIIESAAESGCLAAAGSLVSILYRWEEWATIKEPQDFASSMASTQAGALQLLAAFTQRSFSQGAADHVARERWYIRLQVLEHFVPVAAVTDALADVDVSTLSNEERRGVQCFQEALARRAAGKTDAGTMGHDDDW